MIWSLSAHKQFKRCRRQWFYKNVMADGRVKKDPVRIEATRLSKLVTVAAWRGLVVDQVITVYIIPQLRMKQIPVLSKVLTVARSIFDKQLQLASLPLYSGQKLEIGLLDIEAKGFVDSDDLEQAWHEIETALTNFLQDQDLLFELMSADYLVEQRAMWFKVGNFSGQGFPDLIAFWRNKPPIIYDWKVHFYGTLTYEQQLLVYALALAKGSPQSDFSDYLVGHLPESTRLTEVQLITHTTGHKRQYTVTTSKLEGTESFIADSLLSMYLAGAHRPYAQSCVDDYATTDNPEICTTCSFNKLCKQH
ncbi:PD-(D/E)XK nuclease family protein [Spirosoma gilvum]